MNIMDLRDPEKIASISKEELLQVIGGMGQNMKDRMKAEQLQKVRAYRELNEKAVKGQILFTGSSLMEQFPINEIALSDGDTRYIYNRGIGGTNTDDFLREIDTVLLDLEPTKLFINIGTNDINAREDGQDWEAYLLNNLDKIYTIINEKLPNCETYVMAYYPVNPDFNPEVAAYMLSTRTNEAVNRVNGEVKELAEKHGFTFIDANAGLKDEQGRLKAEYTKEGMHFFPSGYYQVYEAIKQYI